MKGKLVGITLPFYNRRATLARCIQSLLDQKGTGFRIYAVDDGSTDGGNTVVSEFPEVSLTVLPRNFGVATARNLAAMQAISGGCTHIFHMGSDDMLVDDTSLLHMFERLNSKPTHGFVTPWMVKFGDINNKQYRPPRNRTLTEQRMRNALVGAVMYKAEVWMELGGYNMHYTQLAKASFEDWDMTTRALALGYTYAVTDRPVYMYRIHGKTATNDIRPNKDAIRALFQKRAKNFPRAKTM